ncbi:MAG: hypothetical protein ACPH2N_04505 [Flavobacteriaceae bacterium]|jgi:hypothetical protein|tara:strand:+ start:181 stop:699 length:519 start_codon:yes stop_codon:yes gene_type:complete
MGEQILGLMVYCIPALVTGVIAFLFFREHTDNENNRRNFILKESIQKESLPIRLQAYERLTLFLERISPQNLLKRVSPISQEVEDYKSLLIQTVEQEYEHNLSQQIYVSDPCWRIVSAAKNSTIQTIVSFKNKDVSTANDIRPLLLDILLNNEVTAEMALNFLNEEVSILLK